MSHRQETASDCQTLPLYQEQLVLVMGQKQYSSFQESQLSLSQWMARFGVWSFKSAVELQGIQELNAAPGAETIDLGVKNHLDEVLWQALISNAVAILPVHFAKNAIQDGHITVASNPQQPILSSMYINYKESATPRLIVQSLLALLNNSERTGT